MIAWIGVVAAILFFVLWRGGILQELGRRPNGGETADQPALKPPESRAPLVPEGKRLQVFEDFIRSLPEDDGDGPPTASA
jgi:hypothetical protein